MKRGTIEHPKTLMLQTELGVELLLVVGVLESLWHWVAKYAPRGDIGRYSDAVIAAGIGWRGDAETLVGALTKTGWLDADPEHRLVVHDWHEHADRTVRTHLVRHKWTFCNGAGAFGGDKETPPGSQDAPVVTKDRHTVTPAVSQSDDKGLTLRQFPDSPPHPPSPLPLPRPLPKPLPKPEPGKRGECEGGDFAPELPLAPQSPPAPGGAVSDHTPAAPSKPKSSEKTGTTSKRATPRAVVAMTQSQYAMYFDAGVKAFFQVADREAWPRVDIEAAVKRCRTHWLTVQPNRRRVDIAATVRNWLNKDEEQADKRPGGSPGERGRGGGNGDKWADAQRVKLARPEPAVETPQTRWREGVNRRRLLARFRDSCDPGNVDGLDECRKSVAECDAEIAAGLRDGTLEEEPAPGRPKWCVCSDEKRQTVFVAQALGEKVGELDPEDYFREEAPCDEFTGLGDVCEGCGHDLRCHELAGFQRGEAIGMGVEPAHHKGTKGAKQETGVRG